MTYQPGGGNWTTDTADTEESHANGVDQASGSQEVGDQVTQGAQMVAQQAQQTVGQAASQAKQQATSQLSSQKDKATDSLSSVADALRQTSQQLQESGNGMGSQVLDKGAGAVGGAADYLRQRSVSDLIGEVENFARQQTPLFIAGAFALGVAAARFLKSSSSAAQSNTGYRSNYGGYPNDTQTNYSGVNTYSPSTVQSPSSYEAGTAGNAGQRYAQRDY